MPEKEEQRLLGILQDMQAGNKAGAPYRWNPVTKRIERAASDGPGCLDVRIDDLGHAGERRICR